MKAGNNETKLSEEMLKIRQVILKYSYDNHFSNWSIDYIRNCESEKVLKVLKDCVDNKELTDAGVPFISDME